MKIVVRSLLLFGLALILSVHALAIEGRIVDIEGLPIVDATVSIIGRSGTATTDQQGRFVWTPDPVLPFEVLVVLRNGQYMAPALIQEIPSEGVLLIQVSPVAQDEVFVTSDATPHIEAPKASGLSLVKKEEILRSSPTRLTDVIEQLPGVSRVSEGHAVAPAIRGLARGRTLVLIDGGRVTTERRAGPSATYLDPFFLEAVEVARGPGSVAYGSDAFGGVIHAITRSPKAGAPWGFRFQGRLAEGIPEQGAGLEISKGLERGGFLFQSSFRLFDDFSSPLGKQDNSSARSRSFLGRFSHEVGAGLLRLGFQSDQGRDLGRPRNNSDVTRFFYPREDSDRFTAGYNPDPRWGFSRIKFDFFLGTYRLVTTREQLPGGNSPRRSTSSDVDAKDYGFRALFVKPLRRARLELGMDLNGRFGLRAQELVEEYSLEDRLTSSDSEVTIADARKDDTAVYVSTEVQLSRHFSLAGGLRLDRVTTRSRGTAFGDRSTSNTALSGFGSISVRPAERVEITSQYSRGFREPLISDRYFIGVSGRGFITGNPDLDAERSKQFDVAFRYTTGPFRWRLFYYRYRIEDLIERFEKSDDEFFFRNRGSARLQGFEAEVEWLPRPDWAVKLAAQIAHGEALDNGQPLDDIPVESLALSVQKTIRERGYVESHFSLFDRDTRAGPNERVDPGRGTIDLGAGWRFESDLELRFQIRNLFDKDYLISPDRRAILAPGRNASVTLSLAL